MFSRVVTLSRPRSLGRNVIVLGIWTSIAVVFQLAQLCFDTPRAGAVSLGILGSGLLTIMVWVFRSQITSWVSGLRLSPLRQFLFLGGLGAALVETLFLVAEKAMGISGVAANPNLAIDLLVTMPWYLLMLALLWNVETKYSYSLLEIFVLGGIYEAAADGIIAPFLAGKLSLSQLVLLPLIVPLFMVTYSPMLLSPTIILRDAAKRPSSDARLVSRRRRYAFATLPLLGLVPYVALGVLLVLST